MFTPTGFTVAQRYISRGCVVGLPFSEKTYKIPFGIHAYAFMKMAQPFS
jgi:hypothetical protein